MGYHRAGFEVVGVDIKPQPNYPFEFHQADAMDYPLEGFDVIHASPPCQRFSNMSKAWNGNAENHPDHLYEIRRRIQRVPYVIENVVGAPLNAPVQLCGSIFGLRVRRHRWFESNVAMLTPLCVHHWQHADKRFALYQHGHWYKSGIVHVNGVRGKSKGGEHWEEAMGIDWMTAKELVEAIPPAYAEYIGSLLMVYLEHGQAANVLHGERL